jgi:hypothetical protein
MQNCWTPHWAFDVHVCAGGMQKPPAATPVQQGPLAADKVSMQQVPASHPRPEQQSEAVPQLEPAPGQPPVVPPEELPPPVELPPVVPPPVVVPLLCPPVLEPAPVLPAVRPLVENREPVDEPIPPVVPPVPWLQPKAPKTAMRGSRLINERMWEPFLGAHGSRSVASANPHELHSDTTNLADLERLRVRSRRRATRKIMRLRAGAAPLARYAPCYESSWIGLLRRLA